MYLELAEDGGYSLSDQGYELSEDGFNLSDGYQLSQPGGYTTNPAVMKNYVFVPDNDGGKWLHMSMFDDVPMSQFNEFLDAVADYQPAPMDEGLSAGGARKKFKQEKQQQKLDRKAAKTQVIQGRAAIKTSKAGAIDRGETGKGAKALTNIFGKVVDTAGGIVGKFVGGGDAGGAGGKFDVGGNVEFGTGGTEAPEPSFIQKNWPLLAVGAVVVVGGIYFATRNKKR